MRDYDKRLPPDPGEKIRLPGQRKTGNKTEKKLSFLQAMLILVGLAAALFVANEVVGFVGARQTTDALKKATATLELMNVEEAATVSDFTIFVVQQGGKYYVYWKTAAEAGFGLLAYDDENAVSFPFMYKDSTVYPFDTNPFTAGQTLQAKDGTIIKTVELTAGFSAGADSYFIQFVPPAEWSRSIPEDVSVFLLRQGRQALTEYLGEESQTKGVTEEQATGTPKPDAGNTPEPNGTPKGVS